MWEVSKVVFKGKFIVLNTFIRKEQRFEINDVRFHLKKSVKQELIKLKVRIK